MTENYVTTGRPMTRALQDAIDLMPDRHVAISAMRYTLAHEGLGNVRALLNALLLELQLAEGREADLMLRLEAERRAEVDEIDTRRRNFEDEGPEVA